MPLGNMTPQECYEKQRAWFMRPNAVLGKGEKGYLGDNCVYRKGRKPESLVRCAVGCLIPPRLYDSRWDTEGGAISTIVVSYFRDTYVAIFGESDATEGWLVQSQSEHDHRATRTPEQFVAKLDKLAKRWKLQLVKP